MYCNWQLIVEFIDKLRILRIVGAVLPFAYDSVYHTLMVRVQMRLQAPVFLMILYRMLKVATVMSVHARSVAEMPICSAIKQANPTN